MAATPLENNMATKTKKIKSKKVVDYKKKYEMLFEHMDNMLSNMSVLSEDIYDLGLSDKYIVETLKEYQKDTLKLMNKLDK
jgi:hypothetical protein